MTEPELRLLGPTELSRDGEPLALGGPKPRALVAMLALENARVVSVDRLMEALWPGDPPDTARHAVQVYVSQLRKVLGPFIAKRGAGYALELDSNRVDVHRFTRLATAGRAALADGDPAGAEVALREALALWRGPALADFVYEPFADGEIARLEELRTIVLEERIQADLALGRDVELISELRALVAAHPLRERLRGHLIVALYRAGRQAEALAVYRDARRLLSEELGLEPGPALKEIERGVLRQDPALAGPIYLSGASPWPVTAEEWEAKAREILELGPFGFIAGGAGGEGTIRENLAAFERVRLRPKMLAGHTERDTSVEVLGATSPYPFFLAPMGLQWVAHEEAEVATARAAATLGVPYCVPTASARPLEEIADAMGDAQRWFQIYWVNDNDVVGSLVDRAAAAGYSAIVLTVDTPTVGWRPRDIGRAYVPFRGREGIAQFVSDPAFRAKLSVPPEVDPLQAAEVFQAMFPHFHLSWDDLGWLRARTPLPLLVKGILRGDDALRAFEAGADGIVVSNHGGRQVDGAIASLDALVEVRRAVGDDPVVLMDSGIRRGADVLKALALGADAVLVGRIYMYGLAVDGEQGVETVLRQLGAEIDVTLGLIGAASVRELDESWVAVA